MISENKSDKRMVRQFLVLPKLQLKFIFLSGGAALLISVISVSLLYSALKENYDTLIELSPMTEEVKGQLILELKQLVLSISLIFLFFVCLSMVVGAYYSHKLAGPLYRILKGIKGVKLENSNQRIQVRPNDELQELTQDINRLIDLINVKAKNP